MSTYLELCQDVRAEAGLSGTGPSSVLNQSGMYQRIVRWTQQAYAEILRMHTWSFLWARVSPTLTIGQTAYIGTDFTPDITDLGRIYAGKMLDLTSTGTPRIYYRPWDVVDRMLTANPTTTGRPQYFTRRPDDKIVFYPEPDFAYEVQIDYLREKHTLAANADVPLVPGNDLQQIIVYKALEYYAMHDENPAAGSHGLRQFNMLLSELHERYGPPLMTAPISLDQEANPDAMELV